MKKKLLWIGDAVASTGFARCTHKTLAVAHLSFDVHVLGINYNGDPHLYPYSIYPAVAGGDLFGVERTEHLVESLRPDVIVIQQDPWNFPEYVKKINKVRRADPTYAPRIVGAVAVDGKNCRGESLNCLDHAIFWTRFGLSQARSGGFVKPASIIPLGVDTDIYKPMDKEAARVILGLPEKLHSHFIFGNVNRNQPRKRLDLTMSYFADFIRETKAEDVLLFLHIAPTTDLGWDVIQAMKYYGIHKKLVVNHAETGMGVPEEMVAATYNCFDVQMTTTQGEGWGLPTLEGMACGIPQIVPTWSALGEWAVPASAQVSCSDIIMTPNYVNSIGGVPDREEFVGTMMQLYYNRGGEREDLITRGLALAKQYDWWQIGEAFTQVLEEVCNVRPVDLQRSAEATGAVSETIA